MPYLAEQNERQSRTHALVLAIGLHLALAAVLYLYTSNESVQQPKKPEPAKIQKNSPSAPTAKL